MSRDNIPEEGDSLPSVAEEDHLVTLRMPVCHRHV